MPRSATSIPRPDEDVERKSRIPGSQQYTSNSVSSTYVPLDLQTLPHLQFTLIREILHQRSQLDPFFF
jgi:hypothetical protein